MSGDGANEAKEPVPSLVSILHGCNNKLQAVSGNLQLWLDSHSDTEDAELIRTALESADDLGVLINGPPKSSTETDDSGDQDLNGKGEKILVVDDEEVILQSLDILSDMGYSLITASDGKEAVEILQQEAGIQLVLSDFNMPNMSGGALFAWIRKSGMDVKFMFMSAEPGQITDKEGVSEVVQKPFRLKDLLLLIRKVLEG
jgi:CheY-like chemotaxis protein